MAMAVGVGIRWGSASWAAGRRVACVEGGRRRGVMEKGLR